MSTPEGQPATERPAGDDEIDDYPFEDGPGVYPALAGSVERHSSERWCSIGRGVESWRPPGGGCRGAPAVSTGPSDSRACTDARQPQAATGRTNEWARFSLSPFV